MPDIEKLVSAFEDPAIVELMINPDGSVYAETAGKGVSRLLLAPSQQDIAAFLNGVTGGAEAFGPDRPYADLSALDGSRVHVIAPPIARGLTVTIRKRPAARPPLEELVAGETLSQGCADFLTYLVGEKLNILVVGGASSGKTTLLSALAAKAGAAERIVVLEDTPELALPQKHSLYLRTRLRDASGRPDVTLRDLVVNTLRMRPDRIVVGETRGPEAADMLQAMNVGCDGMLTTLHANSAREALTRLETLVLQAGIDMPLKAIRSNIVTAVDFIVFLARLGDGSRKVMQVAEVTGMEIDTISMSDLFTLDVRKGGTVLRPSGAVPRFYDRLRKQGVEPPMDFFRTN
ncbi:MAG: ATPase, T2SS/T4P/T4SS family [Elusimicrobiota bacterium]|nr:ATPase, T2SS/T4P/T4SS family [Elusimicrobiota bacterium]